MPATATDWITAIGIIAGPAISAVAVLLAIRAQKQTQEAQRDLMRPIIRLDEKAVRILFTDTRYVNWDVVLPQQTHMLRLINAGAGLATQIEGVISGPLEDDFYASDRRLTLIVQQALSAGEHSDDVEARIGRTVVYGTSTIEADGEAYTLNADRPRTEADRFHLDVPLVVARLTLTYHDVYGRKHASIYNCTDQGEWITVAFLKDIRFDLDELNRNDRVKRIPGPASVPSSGELMAHRGEVVDQQGLI